MNDEINQEPQQVLGEADSSFGEDSVHSELAPGFGSLLASFESDKSKKSSSIGDSSDVPIDDYGHGNSGAEETNAGNLSSGQTSAELTLTKIYDLLVLGKTVRMIMSFANYNSLRTSLSRKHRTVVESLEEIGGPNPMRDKYVASSFSRTTERCEFSLQDKEQKAATSYRIDSIL